MGLTCAGSEIPARHIAPVVESGDMSTRCAPTFIDEATLNGSILGWAIHREGSLAAWIRRDLRMLLDPYCT